MVCVKMRTFFPKLLNSKILFQQDAFECRLASGHKIIFLLGCLEIGGAEQQALLLARFLKEKCGARVEVWGVSHAGRLAVRCEEAGIPWRVIGNPLVDGFTQTVLRLLRIAWNLRREKVNIILPYTLVPNVIAGAIWRLTGASLCIWNQRDEGTEGHREPFQSWAVKQTPLFVANSSAGANYVIRNLQVHSEDVSVVHNGIALEPSVENRLVWRQRLGLAEDAICVAMIANISSKKDHTTLLRALGELVAKMSPFPGKLKLVLAGRLDDAAQGVINLMTELELENYMTLLGPVRDVAGLLEAVDIGVYSSISEGLPNGVIECMAAGKAIAATDIPGIREALGNDYVFLSKPGDSTGMAAHLITLVTNPELRQEIACRNHERAITCFDTTVMCQKMVGILATHLAGGLR